MEGVMGIVSICALVLSFLPIMLQWELLDEEKVLKSTLSLDFKFSLVAAIALSIPMSADFLLDIISSKMGKRPGNLSRFINYLPLGVLIFSLIVPDAIIFFIAIPLELPGLIICIFQARNIMCVYASQSHLCDVGSAIFRTPLFVTVSIFYNLSMLFLGISAFITGIDPILCFYIHGIFYGIVAIICGHLSLLWIKSIIKVPLNKLTSQQISCFFYLLGISFVCILYVILGSIFNTNGFHSSLYFTATTYVESGYTLIITISHGRINHAAMLHAQQEILDTKRSFVRFVSHEVRTPLNTAFMGLSLLKSQLTQIYCNDDIMEIVKDIKDSCETSRDILTDLLDYEKLEAGIMELDRTLIPAMDFITSTIQPFHMQARQSDINLCISSSTDGLYGHLLSQTLIHGDKHKLSQVIRNLMSNALKFTPKGGSITITVKIIEEEENSNTTLWNDNYNRNNNNNNTNINNNSKNYLLQITVIDTGVGISNENIGKIFKEIVQFNANELQNGGGSGMGLWISKSIVELHNGGIYVDSEGEGHGCTFTVKLPIQLKNRNSIEDTSADNLEHTIDIHYSIKTENNEKSTKVYAITDPSTNTMQNNNDSNTNSNKKKNESRQSLYLVSDDIKESSNCIKSRNNEMTIFDSSQVEEINNSINILEEKEELDSNPTFIVLRKSVIKSRKSERFDQVLVSSKSVLIVDDAPMNRKMLRRLIKEKGEFQHIEEAVDGVHAVSMVKESMRTGHVFDLILMDFQMPNMDGPAATAVIRELGYKGLIIGVTGNALPSDIGLFMSKGADRVLLKPVDIHLLEETIRGLENLI